MFHRHQNYFEDLLTNHLRRIKMKMPNLLPTTCLNSSTKSPQRINERIILKLTLSKQ
jgi:hypothetical protein